MNNKMQSERADVALLPPPGKLDEFIRSTPASQPNKVGVICLSARPSVRLSVHKKFLRFQ